MLTGFPWHVVLKGGFFGQVVLFLLLLLLLLRLRLVL